MWYRGSGVQGCRGDLSLPPLDASRNADHSARNGADGPMPDSWTPEIRASYENKAFKVPYRNPGVRN
eukprot:495801-Heterocapsa_arctica.AAC.1